MNERGKVYGRTEPRLFTPPLRELTPLTSNGDAFIIFCREILGVELFPWQKWLARHAFELNADGTYRYRQVLVMVGRQNGKTTFLGCAAAWWLFVDALHEPGRTPDQFLITGVAQNVKTASRMYNWLAERCDPDPDEEKKKLVIPRLQGLTYRVRKANGSKVIETKESAKYEVQAGKSVRGDPCARMIMDEVREQHDWDIWDATSQTPKSFVNGQLWGISNAGRAKSVVLHRWRSTLLRQVELAAAEGDAYAEHPDADPTVGLFEWSAPEDAKPLDVDAILQANPSIGYSGITLATCRTDYAGMPLENYRAEVLCQYVPTNTTPYIDPKDHEDVIVKPGTYSIPKGARVVWAVDVSVDRQYTSIACAVECSDGRPLVQLAVNPRLGTFWAVDELEALANATGCREVMVQERGCPAMEFVEPLESRGLTVRRVPGSWFGIATGRMRDAIRDRRIRMLDQPSVSEAVAAGVTRRYGETDAWDRTKSAVDIAPLVACSLALYGLENPVDVPLSAYAKRGLLTI